MTEEERLLAEEKLGGVTSGRPAEQVKKNAYTRRIRQRDNRWKITP